MELCVYTLVLMPFALRGLDYYSRLFKTGTVIESDQLMEAYFNLDRIKKVGKK